MTETSPAPTQAETQSHAVDISVVMPCLNEEDSLEICITKAQSALSKLDMTSEVVISDNGSTDRSVEIAESLGARVVHQPIRGYGNAYHKGISEARGTYIVIGDSDDTYPFDELADFIAPLQNGADMVMGSRLKGEIQKGAMPFLHRYLGNPVLTGILNLFFRTGISDAHCGMRSFTKEAYNRLDLHTSGMEYASEMVIEAGRKDLDIKEVPITYSRRAGGQPKLNTWSDGWRHLRFMLLESPEWVFTIPGALLAIVGLSFVLSLAGGPISLGGQVLDFHFMIMAAMGTIIGTEILLLGLAVKRYAMRRGFDAGDRFTKWLWRVYTLEKGLTIGSVIFAAGLAGDIFLVIERLRGESFADLSNLRLAILAMTLTVLGLQIVFNSFFLSMLNVKEIGEQ